MNNNVLRVVKNMMNEVRGKNTVCKKTFFQKKIQIHEISRYDNLSEISSYLIYRNMTNLIRHFVMKIRTKRHNFQNLFLKRIITFFFKAYRNIPKKNYENDSKTEKSRCCKCTFVKHIFKLCFTLPEFVDGYNKHGENPVVKAIERQFCTIRKYLMELNQRMCEKCNTFII